MSDQSRALPARPNLRYLKLEAKRRLAAGEFATLHEAQLAIAREHGQPSWTALKELITAISSQASHALAQVRWLAARFAAAGSSGWTAPGEGELQEHFTERFLTVVPPGTLISSLTRMAERLREEILVVQETPAGIRAQIDDMQVEAAAEAGPPHRLTALRAYPLGRRVTDPRAAQPSTRTTGEVPPAAAAVAAESLTELGLPGLVLAGAAGDGSPWTLARGWADLERGVELRGSHSFPAYSLTKLITATAVLRLAASGQLGLDAPANDYLRAIRLADDGVTVRELLSHTGGVDSPRELFASSVPDLVSLTGPVIGCSGERGTFAYSNGGYAALGQLIADVTGTTYEEAATALVLAPLGMTSSSFPATCPASGAITGYRLAPDGSFEPVPAEVATIPAAGGLWATAADLARFGLSWRSLLPDELAREALRRRPAAIRPGRRSAWAGCSSSRKTSAGTPTAGTAPPPR